MPNILGTLGAVIAMKSPIPNRKALFDIGIAGPLAGLVLAIPAVAIGLHFSELRPLSQLPSQGMIHLGEPALFRWISEYVLGAVPSTHDVILHPAAFAGWAILFVTSINLFPVGQLDGGHMLYAMVGRRAKHVSWLVIIGLLYLGLRVNPMWFGFVAMILLFIFRHPAPLDNVTPIGRTRWLLGLLTFLLMSVCFSPVPFDLDIPSP
jgi:membrane-associated protease RseP (regulator of RpoE activity)